MSGRRTLLQAKAAPLEQNQKAIGKDNQALSHLPASFPGLQVGWETSRGALGKGQSEEHSLPPAPSCFCLSSQPRGFVPWIWE